MSKNQGFPTRSYVNGNVPASEWPFGDHDGVNDDAEKVDALIIVLLSKNEIFAHGGTVGIDVDVREIMQFPDAERFFGNIAFSDGDSINDDTGEFMGTFQLQDTSDYQRGVDFNVERCTNVVLHEFTHTLGFADGPPNLAGISGALDTRRYYYGSLNNLCQKFMPGRGPNIMGLHNLARTGWVDVVDFTGENLLDQVVYDLRSDGAGNSEQQGKIFKFQSEKPGFSDQYFLFAYHAGKGVDRTIWPGASGPVLNSTGLEAQHVVGLNDPEIVDIESAFGLYHNIISTEMPLIDLPPFPSGDIPGWGDVANSEVMGFDNYDLWWLDGDPQSLRLLVENGNWAGYTTYMGDVFDFFTADTLEVGNATWTSPEFSWRSNPNCFLYGSGGYSGQSTRHNLQDEPNSLMVRIKEQHDNPESGPPYMVVDFISAPFGEIVEPVAEVPGEMVFFNPGDGPLEITWDTDFLDIIDRVDVLLSLNGGISFPVSIVENFAVTGGVTSYSWVPGDESFGTNSGQIKVVFKNQYTDYTTESVTPDPLGIAMTTSISEDILFPENGEVFEVGDECTLLWANYFGSTIQSVDLWFSVDDGGSWVEVESGLLPGIDYLVNEDGLNEYGVVLLQSMASANVHFKLVFHDGIGEAENETVAPVTILPRTQVEFDDVTVDSHVVFSGDTYSLNAFFFGPGNGVGENDDLLVSLAGAREEVKLFKNSGTGMEFATNQFAFQTGSPQGISGTASGDLDNDGDQDLICASPDNPGVFLFEEVSEVFVDILSNTSYFSSVGAEAFKNSFTPVLVDCDRDGDLDIFLGRAEKQADKLIPLADALFIQGPDGSFEELAGPLGLATKEGTTLSAAWCDFDADGWWEVVVGDAGQGETFLYDQVEATNGQGFIFEPRVNPFPVNLDGGVVSLQWADMDQDGDFDLSVTRDGAPSLVMFNEAGLFPQYTEVTSSSDMHISNSAVVDFDYDGWTDVTYAGGKSDLGTAGPQARIYRHLGGVPGFSSDTWRPIEGALGLGDRYRIATGLLFDDFDLDGGLDAVIGAQTTSNGDVVFQCKPRDGNSNFSNQWLGVDVLGAADNKSSVGAVVRVRTTSGELLGTRIVDGGSGRGGQQPRRLFLGLGNTTENIEIEVTWPANPDLSILEVVRPSGFNQVMTISQDTGLEIHRPTIAQTMEIVPGTDLVNRIFTWKSNRLTQQAQDKIYIWDGPNYTNLVAVLEVGVPQVLVWDPQYKIDPDSGEVSFEHRVEWTNQECVLGYSFKYEVESCIDSNCVPESSRFSIINNRVCPSWH